MERDDGLRLLAKSGWLSRTPADFRDARLSSSRWRRQEAGALLTLGGDDAAAGGMAAGDMAATSLGLGYLGAGVLFAGVILVPALAYWRFGLPEIPAFWFAYIMTRPLGASFADWMGVSHARSGLDWGTGPVSLGLAALIFGFVWIIARKETLA